MGTYGEVGAVAGPLDARDTIAGANVTQFSDFTVHGRPQVDAGAEAHSKHILG